MPAGRPSAYSDAFCEQAENLALLGATDAEMANFFHVNQDTLQEWKKRYSEFSESIDKGKIGADARMAKSLYHRGLGYSHEAVKIFNGPEGPVYAPYTEHYPPDTQAASLWLRNRQPKRWRDRIEHTGADGEPIQVQHQFI